MEIILTTDLHGEYRRHGIYLATAYGGDLITGCTIRGNGLSSGCYGGIYTTNGNGTICIDNNLIYDNGDFGIKSYNDDSLEIWNNTILGHNYSIYRDPNTTPMTITNCILWDNTDDLFDCTASYSCFSGGSGDGNISSDPLFDEDGLHLTSNSPCIDVGDPNGDYDGQVDIDGDSREIDGDGQNGAEVDMGADEYDPEA